MTRRDQYLLLLAGLLAAGVSRAALTLDRSAPISIEADSALIDEPSGTAVYRGRVLLRQGTIHLEAGELTLHVKDGRAEKAIATGNPVRLEQEATETQESTRAEARRITFLVGQERMVLENRARLTQGSRLFQGAHIDYEVANRRVNATGGEQSRVLLVLPPAPSGEQGGTPPTGKPSP